jgi:hypothetical protein
MSTEDDIAVLVAARDDATLSWRPTTDLPQAALATVRRRQHRRTVVLATAAAVALAGAIAVPVAITRSGNSGSADRLLTGPWPSASAAIEPSVDFTVGYLPAGYRYFHTEHAPRSVATDATRSYALHGNPHNGVISIEVQFGLVSTLTQYRRYNGPLRDTTVAGHPAVIGWNTGHVGDGLRLLYLLVDSHTSIEVTERSAVGITPLPDPQLEQVAAAVTVTTSGPATSTITIPDVRGLSQQAAVDALTAAGAGVPTVENQHGTAVPRDHVISQSPTGGKHVPRGTSVTLKIAR